ncbi:polysaccharide deacetylase family protein [Sphingobacterium alkalisoli]|uniref:Polysaccharide deacetylase family protein n=1 Tax=Sphingobacterium alkalisoli TaxID=1874115 RepID=A0A4U0GVP8_9SPHI|nr:polysaccharide deacetylase family protein [Sphingobacterium alkalisoli]TJY62654.1 polysaccharide deacetylase family protein [Sphingobacterium alkalisoli]GGH28017.1 polysaccharide deacetylase [Sphingobacterium alkalisoli]
MYFVNAPIFLRWYYPNVIWNKSRHDKKLYLTFDDGPVPEITPWILDVLDDFNIKASFFCVGENIEKHPEIFDRIIKNGHQVGNHTYNHLRGWDHNDDIYIENIMKCQRLTKSHLFRPPYARAKKSQLSLLSDQFELIYWDVLSGDFDLNLSPQNCLQNVLKHTKNGSIIVFHDNIKAIPRVQYALPKAIEHFLKRGFSFETL